MLRARPDGYDSDRDWNEIVTDENSDLAVLTVQALTRVRAIAQDLEARGRLRSDIDREIRENPADVAPAIRASLRLEMTTEEIARCL
jgi:hypothetical protein